MKKLNIVLGLVITGCVMFVGFRAVKEDLIKKMSVAEMIDGKSTNNDVYVYESRESKYKISIPGNWGVAEGTSDAVFESRLEATPPKGELKVSKINVDVVKAGVKVADLYTEDDFNKWDAVGTDTDINGITKFGESEVSGEKVLLLADLTKVGESPTGNDWSLLGWFRKDGRNFYVRMFGKQNVDDEDKQVFKYLLGTMEVE